ncbi:MAG TPA: ABC transporter ATP-binding protein, partial [Pontiella sp.]|nr:ABC transporter ATP-binding protein [Pontiella sp.]
MTQPAIQIEDLHIQLSGQDILNNVSLSVNCGEYISIIGPNGAGKTTLIKCIAGIHRHWRGMIRINGKSFSELRPKQLARLQSYVPQAEGRYIPLTVEQFVAMGRYPHLSAFTTLTAEDRRAIESALEQAGLIAFRHRAMNTLSGGERQMAFIAAALAQGAGILLLDEPSTFLDYRHQTNVSSLLKKACRENGITVLAVHHDVNTAASSSDRIYALKQGSIAVEGRPSEIADAEVLKNIYGTEFHITPSPHRA